MPRARNSSTSSVIASTIHRQSPSAGFPIGEPMRLTHVGLSTGPRIHYAECGPPDGEPIVFRARLAVSQGHREGSEECRTFLAHRRGDHSLTLADTSRRRVATLKRSAFCSTTAIMSTTIVTSSTSRTRRRGRGARNVPGRHSGRADGLEHRDPLINRPATRAPDRPGSSGAPAPSTPRPRPPGTPPRHRHGCRDRGA